MQYVGMSVSGVTLGAVSCGFVGGGGRQVVEVVAILGLQDGLRVSTTGSCQRVPRAAKMQTT
ncbi:hypothetical protein GCM10025792_24190 [Pseudonocardia tropica]